MVFEARTSRIHSPPALLSPAAYIFLYPSKVSTRQQWRSFHEAYKTHATKIAHQTEFKQYIDTEIEQKVEQKPFE